MNEAGFGFGEVANQAIVRPLQQRRFQYDPNAPTPLDMVNEDNSLNRSLISEISLKDSLEVPNTQNLHIGLQKIMEKFNLKSESLDSLIELSDHHQLSEIIKQL